MKTKLYKNFSICSGVVCNTNTKSVNMKYVENINLFQFNRLLTWLKHFI